jgi:small subunit ribosomal protein S8e
MTHWLGKSGTKPSGGRYWPARKSKSREIGRDEETARIGEAEQKKQLRTRGGHQITKLLGATHANLCIDAGRFKKSKIITAKENPSNRHFVRMNVITRGAIIQTEDGLARVTSRPSREGIVNAVLVKAQ